MACCCCKSRFCLAFAALLIAVVGTFVFFPWKSLLEDRLKTSLEAQGFQNVQLVLSQADFRKLTLQNLALGDTTQPTAQTLEQLTADYSLRNLFSGQVQSLSATGLNLEARQIKEKWSLAGQSSTPSNLSFALPTTDRQLAAIPFEQGQLDKSRLVLAAENWRMEVPLNLTWQKTPSPQLTYKADGLKFKAKELAVDTGELAASAELKPQEALWDGAWTLKDIKVSGPSTPVPTLYGKGKLAAKAESITLDGTLESADSQVSTTFRMTYNMAEPQKSELVLPQTSFPWNEGTLSAQNIVLPLGEPKPVNVNLKLQRLSLNALLEQLTGKRASGTGTLSGALPLTLEADGNILIHEGTLSAEGPGIIQMSPDVIPGDNAQITLVRDVLKNLKYTSLTVDVKSEANNRLVILMRVTGSNPKTAKGRPIQLNVKLTGDVLDFVQQNILSLTDPRKFLEQSGHAKP